MRIVFFTAFLLVAAGCKAEPVPDSLESDLKATITRANQAFIRAVRSNDPAQLSPHFSGDILASLSKSIGRAKEEGRYSISELQDVRWREVRVRNTEAQVEATERWKHTHRSKATDKCAFVVPARDVSQTYHMTKRSGVWKITKIVDAPDNEPAKAVPCTE